MSSEQRQSAALADVLRVVVDAAGFDLEEVAVRAAGRRRQVQVTVDRDGGVDLDAVAALSRALGVALDEHPDLDGLLGSGAYVLEVGSRGVDRPLTEPRHWRRAITRLVEVTLRDGTTVIGRVASMSTDTAVMLLVDGASVNLNLATVRRAVVQVEFSHAGAPTLDADLDDAELAGDLAAGGSLHHGDMKEE